jgi:hypothetical protein
MMHSNLHCQLAVYGDNQYSAMAADKGLGCLSSMNPHHLSRCCRGLLRQRSRRVLNRLAPQPKGTLRRRLGSHGAHGAGAPHELAKPAWQREILTRLIHSTVHNSIAAHTLTPNLVHQTINSDGEVKSSKLQPTCQPLMCWLSQHN